MTDFLIVGAGLYGAVCARELKDAGRSVLVIERRPHIAGNVYTERIAGIDVHRYGAHIFHTNDADIWRYVQRFAEFNRFTNSPMANYRGEMYSLPFNMLTFNRMWGCTTPQQAMDIIASQRREVKGTPANLEEQAISLVGRDIYDKLIKGYTEQQWGRDCRELPAFIIRRLPVRFCYDNNYFNARFQGIPIGGYTQLVARMLEGIEVLTDTDYLSDREMWDRRADRVIYTGPIDAYFDHVLGPLAYRSVRFETELLDCANYQGNAVVNYTDPQTPWTRIIEHKWFTFGLDENGLETDRTVISREYSSEWKPGDEPYYPVNDEKNTALLRRYQAMAAENGKLVIGGRLGEYRYYDMDQAIGAALGCVRRLLAEG